MSIYQNRPEAVRKYFTKTPYQPNHPDYSSHHKKMTLGGVIVFLGLLLLFSGNGFFIFLGLVSGYFGFRSLSNGFSEYSEKKLRYEKDLEQ